MMKNKKSLLWVYAVISLVLIVAAVIVSLTAGISTGTDVGGGYQIEVKVSSETNLNEAVKDLKEAMKSSKVTAEKVFVEDKFTDTYVVAKTNVKNIKNEEIVKNKIADKMNVSVDDIEIFAFDGSVTNKTVIWTSVGVVCLLLALFIMGWIRYGIVSATSLTIVALHTLLVSASLMIITRLPITMVSVIAILASVVLVILASILLLERIRENKKMKHNESLTANEIVSLSNKETYKPLLMLTALLAVVCLCLICVPVRLVTLSALSLFVCLAVAVYSYYLVGTNFTALMLTLSDASQKAKLSKNVSPAPKAKKTK